MAAMRINEPAHRGVGYMVVKTMMGSFAAAKSQQKAFDAIKARAVV